MSDDPERRAIGYDGIGMETTPPQISAANRAEFDAAARRTLAQRWRYAFVKTYKPVLDDARFRSFATTRDYRDWCETHLPRFLGYHRV